MFEKCFLLGSFTIKILYKGLFYFLWFYIKVLNSTQVYKNNWEIALGNRQSI